MLPNGRKILQQSLDWSDENGDSRKCDDTSGFCLKKTTLFRQICMIYLTKRSELRYLPAAFILKRSVYTLHKTDPVRYRASTTLVALH